MQKTSEKLPQFRSLALVSVGSNENFDNVDVTSIVSSAIHSVVEGAGVIRAKSRFFRTPAFPVGAGPDYVNAAFSVATNFDAAAILERLHATEALFGRQRKARWASRTLDLDLIAFDDQVCPDRKTYLHWAGLALEDQMTHTPTELILPHPRLHERAFVLVPLMDIAPDWVHPVTGRTVRVMHDALPEKLIQEAKPL